MAKAAPGSPPARERGPQPYHAGTELRQPPGGLALNAGKEGSPAAACAEEPRSPASWPRTPGDRTRAPLQAAEPVAPRQAAAGTAPERPRQGLGGRGAEAAGGSVAGSAGGSRGCVKYQRVAEPDAFRFVQLTVRNLCLN